MQDYALRQYPSDRWVFSSLDRMEDAFDLITMLTSAEVVDSLLRAKYGLNARDAKRLAKRITSHAKLADQYARSSLIVAPEISFLHGYYGILNLMKIVCLFGPYRSEFDQNTGHHGATYSSRKTNSHSLLSAQVTLKKGGVLALYYKTIVGTALSKSHVISMKEAYSGITSVSAEYNFLLNKNIDNLEVAFKADFEGMPVFVEAHVQKYFNGKRQPFKGTVRNLPFLIDYRKKPKSEGIFVRKIDPLAGQMADSLIPSTVNFSYLSRIRKHDLWIMLHKEGAIHIPEELATAIAMFHMSSVVRYDPEFIIKLKDSKYWTLLLSLRRHGLYEFILSSYSRVIKEDYRFLSD